MPSKLTFKGSTGDKAAALPKYELPGACLVLPGEPGEVELGLPGVVTLVPKRLALPLAAENLAVLEGCKHACSREVIWHGVSPGVLV